jgi:hypothetical protein
MTEYLLGVLLVLTIAWLFVRVRQNNTAAKADSRPKPKKQNKYQAVAIQNSENSCDAAKAMTGRRFLVREAPRLPLDDCDFGDCRCKYANYDDLRSNSERRNPFSHPPITDGTGTFRTERRVLNDRRSNSEDQ